MFRTNCISGVLVALWCTIGLAADLVSNQPRLVSLSTQVLAVAASPKGEFVAVGGKNGMLCVLDAATLKVRWRVAPGVYDTDAHITGVGFIKVPAAQLTLVTEGAPASPWYELYQSTATDQAVEILVVSSWDTTIRFFDAATGTFLYRSAELEPLDRTTLVTGYDPRLEGAALDASKRARDRRYPSIKSLAIAPNGRWLAFTTRANILEQWDTRFWLPGKGERIGRTDGLKHNNYLGLGPTAISSTGQYLVSSSRYCTVYTAKTFDVVSRFYSPTPEARAITAVAWRPGKETQLAVADRDGHLVLWEVTPSPAPLEKHGDGSIIKFGEKKEKDVQALEKKGIPLAARARLLDLQAEKNPPVQRHVYHLKELDNRAHEAFARAIAFSSDGRFLASAGCSLTALYSYGTTPLGADSYEGVARTQNHVRVWDAETGELVGYFNNGRTELPLFPGQEGTDNGTSATAVAFSSDGMVYAGFSNGDLCAWSLGAKHFVATTAQ